MKKKAKNKLLNIFLNKKFLAILVGLFYFIALFVTMSDYNMPWDGRTHYFKGQAFANFFLYGRKDYKNLPVTKDYVQYYRGYVSKFYKDPNIESRISKDLNYRRSIFEEDFHTFQWLMDSKWLEHPVLSDIGSSFSNIIFYEKLGILRDDYAYRVYTLILASVLVTVVFYWMLTMYGLFPAVVSTIALATAPLFWAEAHFSIKDVPSVAFFTLSLWMFWRGIIKNSKITILFSALFAGCAFGTRINIAFLPFIVIPWLLLFYFRKTKKERLVYKSFLWLVIAYPIIMFGLIFVVWPQLWQNPIESFLTMINFYRSVGISPDYTPNFRTIFHFNAYASIWIFFTTYPLVGVLGIIGIISAIINIRKLKNTFLLLLLLWFFVPIIRSSLPFTSIFGGVRHLMEYIPALSLLAGYGSFILIKKVPDKFRTLFMAAILLGFIPLIITLVKLHPAENVYFNSLIGGLNGAKKANITGWGYNDGGIYRKATIWLNEHAEKGSHIATAFSEPADFYIPELRNDLLADNLTSGYYQKGEYIIALTNDTGEEDTYNVKYPETFLQPVYEYVVDGVPLIKIWKNDKQHLKKEFSVFEIQDINLMPSKEDNTLTWKLDSKKRIMAVEIEFDKTPPCKDLEDSNFQISEDGQNWTILPGAYPGGPLTYLGNQPKGNKLIAPIAGVWGSYISFVISPKDSCMFNVKNSKVVVLR